jgi:Periplasmic binding protein
VHIVAYSFTLAHVPFRLPRERDRTGSCRTCFPCVLRVLFLLLSLGSQAAETAPGDPPADIALGMSTVLTGSSGALGNDMQRGVLAGLARANRTTSLQHRRLRLIALDDGYLPARAAVNTRQLIEKDGVLAVIGNVGTPTAVVTVPLANQEKTLLFAPFAGGPILRNDPPDRYVINFRAGLRSRKRKQSSMRWKGWVHLTSAWGHCFTSVGRTIRRVIGSGQLC